MQATTVAARGLAESPYTVAGFSLALSDKGTTVPTAKTRLKKKVDELNTALDALRTKLGIEYVKNSVRASSSVQENWEYQDRKNEFKGYIVNYNFFFQIEELDKVNEVYDTLTTLSEVRVANPTFGLKPSQRERLNKKALKNAFEKAAARFETECEVLGLNPADFKIASWEATYHDSQRGERVAGHMAARMVSNSYEAPIAAAAPMGGGGAGETSLDLVAGLAEVVVNLEVGYAEKVTQTVKAQVVSSSNGLGAQKENHV